MRTTNDVLQYEPCNKQSTAKKGGGTRVENLSTYSSKEYLILITQKLYILNKTYPQTSPVFRLRLNV